MIYSVFRYALVALSLLLAFAVCCTGIHGRSYIMVPSRILLSKPKGSGIVRFVEISYTKRCDAGDRSVKFSVRIEQRKIKTLSAPPYVSVVLTDDKGHELSRVSKTVNEQSWRQKPGLAQLEFKFDEDLFAKAKSVKVICSIKEGVVEDVFEGSVITLFPDALSCTVTDAEGKFNPYCICPKRGDTFKLNVQKLLTDTTKGALYFDDFSRSGLYVVTGAPFRLTRERRDDCGNFVSCRLEASGSLDAKYYFDIIAPREPDTEPWKVYYIAEQNGSTEAIIVFTAKPVECQNSGR